MRAALELLYKTSGLAAGFFLVAIAVLTAAQILGRVLGMPAYSFDDFAGFSMCASSFLGLAYTLRANEHIRMTLVLHHIADPGRVLAEAARVVRKGGRLLIADMLPHDHDEYRRTMGHVWLGFSERQIERWCTAAGFQGLRWHPLPVEPGVKGPGLFVMTACRARL